MTLDSIDLLEIFKGWMLTHADMRCFGLSCWCPGQDKKAVYGTATLSDKCTLIVANTFQKQKVSKHSNMGENRSHTTRNAALESQ